MYVYIYIGTRKYITSAGLEYARFSATPRPLLPHAHSSLHPLRPLGNVHYNVYVRQEITLKAPKLIKFNIRSAAPSVHPLTLVFDSSTEAPANIKNKHFKRSACSF